MRAVLLDRRNRIFLHRFVLPDDPGVWFTPGGAIEANETDDDALRRELREELRYDGFEIGPWIWKRRQVWFWSGQDQIYDTRERFALVRVPNVRALKPTAHDALLAGPNAREEHAWWTAEEIAASDAVFAPRRLAELLEDLIANGPPVDLVDVGR